MRVLPLLRLLALLAVSACRPAVDLAADRAELLRLHVPRQEHVVFAWVEIYEKRDGKWTLTLVASTDRPGGGLTVPRDRSPARS